MNMKGKFAYEKEYAEKYLWGWPGDQEGDEEEAGGVQQGVGGNGI